ncbi:MAG: glycerol-3-phosphate acyltransferase [Gammaproteobacteria bacterium]|nr:MAG: glycerol-3-phosphate acyltransferase [Gammaproteobacteria bacterium]
MKIPDHNTTSPWPESVSGLVFFLLDCANDFEFELLYHWIGQARPDPLPDYRCLRVRLNNDRHIENSVEVIKSCLDYGDDAVLVPLRVMWRQSAQALNSGPRLRDLILGDPRRPSVWRAKRILAKQPERVLLNAGAEATLGTLRRWYQENHATDQGDPVDGMAKFVARQATVALEIVERHVRGSRYKVPRYVAETLRSRPSFIDDLDKLAVQQKTSREALLDEAGTYMKEMVTRPTMFWLDVYARFNNSVLGLSYQKEVEVNAEDLAKMRDWVRDNPALLLWTHKTYLDGVVVPKLMYENDFPMPHMFGGANLSFAGLAFLLRRAGGIFIRRSFQDNPVYKLTMRHYISLLMEKRFPLSWSFEGTRSRIGKLMPPKYGLLKYVLEACHASDARNIYIIPLSISYDLIRDVEEYAQEQVGRVKKPESLSWFVGYLRSLAKPMGKAYMNIGEPVILEQAPDPDDKLALSKIAFEVAVAANKATPITYTSLVTLCLLGAAPVALTESELDRESDLFLDYARARNFPLSPDFERDRAAGIEQLVELMIREGMLTRYEGGSETVYAIAPEQAPVASYYRNTIIHFFVNKALIELALLSVIEACSDDPVQCFWDAIDVLRDLFKFEFFYPPSDVFQDEIRAELERYDNDWEQRLRAGKQSTQNFLAGMEPLLAHIALLTFVEAYYVAADYLAGLPAEDSLSQKTCIDEGLKRARQAYLQRRISSEASIGKLLLSNAWSLFNHRGLTEGGDAVRQQQRVEQAQQFRQLLLQLEEIRSLAVINRSRRGEALELTSISNNKNDGGTA